MTTESTDMKKKCFYLIDADDLSVKGKTELSEDDVKIVKNLDIFKAIVAAMFIILFAVIAQQFTSSKVQIAKMSKAHVVEVEALLDELDSVTFCYDESVRMNDLRDAIVEAVVDGYEKPTHDNIWEFIQKCNSWYPDIIMAQAVQESDCGKSAVAKRCNNLFGMTKPSSRKLRCDINRHNKSEKYAEYHNWKMSIIDRIFWERCMFENTDQVPSREKYLCKVGTVYNTETEGYAQKIDKISRKYR